MTRNKVSKNAVMVFTSEFEFSHGKRPSGFGHWGFNLGRVRRLDQSFWFSGKFGEAKKAAVAAAAERGETCVYVLS